MRPLLREVDRRCLLMQGRAKRDARAARPNPPLADRTRRSDSAQMPTEAGRRPVSRRGKNRAVVGTY
jgi:hypothetical protein